MYDLDPEHGHGPTWVVPPVGTSPRGRVEYPPLSVTISDDTTPPGEDTTPFRVDLAGQLWRWANGEWHALDSDGYVIDPRVIDRIAKRTSQRGWPVYGLDIQVDKVGEDGLPVEQVEINGVVYHRLWSMTDNDWVYAA